ncbi:MAG: PEP-CTERM sorting domain-containing protein, partial [Verrucomicrobiaceae bacterium]
PYRLTLIPEPSSLSVLTAVTAGLLLPRRRSLPISHVKHPAS